MIKSNGDHVSAVGRGIEGPGLGDYSGKDDLHGYGYFYETFLRTHGVIETFFFTKSLLL